MRVLFLVALLTSPAAAENGIDFDGNRPAGAIAAERPRKGREAPGKDASPVYRAIRSDKGVDVYSELASPEAEDQAAIPGAGSLRLGTQLRAGESVQVVRENGDWLYVNVPGQNYSGWVRRQELSPDPDGSLAAQFPAQRSVAADEQTTPLRQAFVKETESWDGTSYKWGGITKGVGVDCSGLVKGAMDAVGLGKSVPRTAADQQKAAKPVASGRDLAPGDLIFTAKGGGDKISHVVVYVGNGEIREAMMSGTKVQKKPFQGRFGTSPENLSNGGKAGSHKIYFGTFF